MLMSIWDWIWKIVLIAAESKVQRPQTSANNLQLTVNPSAGFCTCASTGINFPSSLNRDDWFQGLAANLSKL